MVIIIHMHQDYPSGEPISGIYKFHNATLMLPSGTSGIVQGLGAESQIFWDPTNSALVITSGSKTRGFSF